MASDLDPRYRPPAHLEPAVRALCERILPVAREAARSVGYAIGVHGSMVRDLDLIACPWTEDAVEPRALAIAIQDAIAAALGCEAFRSEAKVGLKPHGRLCFNIYLQGDCVVRSSAGAHPFIDLSVMPRA